MLIMSLHQNFITTTLVHIFQESSMGAGDGWGNAFSADSNIFTAAIGETLVLS